jgi:hypothetical protein
VETLVFSLQEGPESTEATLFINGRVEAKFAVKSKL